MRKLLIVFALLTVSAALALANGSAEKSATGTSTSKKYTMVMVVKITGIAWFNNMKLGIERFGKDHPDVNISQTGGATADPALQVQIVNNQIAKGVNAVLAVPNDPNSLVPSFKRARNDGIVVATQEASNLQVGNYDVEAFHDFAYGKFMMNYMAKWMGDKGLWQPFVGHLTAPSHNQWVDGEQAEAKAKYPGLTQASKRIVSDESEHVAYEKSLELLKKYPNLKAIMGSAMTTVPGAAQAITEKGLIGKVAAFGTCLPSVAGAYLESGAAQEISFWIPSDAGYEVAMSAYDALKGIKVTTGMNLGRPGYGSVTVVKNKYGVPVIYGSAMKSVTKKDLSQWKNPDGSWKL